MFSNWKLIFIMLLWDLLLRTCSECCAIDTTPPPDCDCPVFGSGDYNGEVRTFTCNEGCLNTYCEAKWFNTIWIFDETVVRCYEIFTTTTTTTAPGSCACDHPTGGSEPIEGTYYDCSSPCTGICYASYNGEIWTEDTSGCIGD